MLTGSRVTGRSSEKTSIRSTSLTIRSASSRISRVKVRSSLADRRVEKLRRAPDAGQGILDLMRQHAGERGDTARRAAMGQLTVELLGDGALLEQKRHMVRPVDQRRDENVRQPVAADPGRPDIDPVFDDRRATIAGLFDELVDRTAEWQEILDPAAAQDAPARLEEGFGGIVDKLDRIVRVDEHDGMRQGGEHRVRQISRPARRQGLLDARHAARPMSASCAHAVPASRASASRTRSGSVSVRMALPAPLRRRPGQTRSMVQATCLRATRTPISTP